MKIQVILEPSDEGGYTAIVPALPGCISEGNTKAEALNNMREAIELYIASCIRGVHVIPVKPVLTKLVLMKMGSGERKSRKTMDSGSGPE